MASNPHNRQTKPGDDDDDPVERMLKKAGCLEQHYKGIVSRIQQGNSEVSHPSPELELTARFSGLSPHNYPKQNTECMVDHKDWRICQPHVLAFKECIEESKKRDGLERPRE